MKELEFDVVVHLAGEQTVPNYMGVKLSEAKRHILLVTRKTEKQGEMLSKMFPARERFIENVQVDATDFAAIAEAMRRIPGLDGLRIGVNVTGGTKPMFAAALDYCREKSFIPFYLDTQNRMISFFSDDFRRLPMPKVFSSVEEFARLGGYRIKGDVKRADDISETRRRLIKEFWLNKDYVRRVIHEFSKATDRSYENRKNNPPECYLDALDLISRPRKGNKKEEQLAEAWEAEFPSGISDWRKAARFGAGEWFEEWLLLQFADSRKGEGFCDLCSGVSLAFFDGDEGRSIQELDLAYTDGYDLTIIECKAGVVAQEHVQKLENLRRQIGGVMGRGFLCTINYQFPSDIVVERVRNGSISLISGDKALRMLPNRHDRIKARRCYQGECDYDDCN